MKITRKTSEIEKYSKLTELKIEELIVLHKMYCISLHPLWKQVSDMYWEFSEKYWTPKCQVVGAKNFQEITESVVNCLKQVESFQECKGDTNVQENILLGLMEYYGVEVFRDGKSLDSTCFSAMMVYVFSQFFPFVNIYIILYSALAAFFSIAYGVTLPSEFYQNLPIVKVRCI